MKIEARNSHEPARREDEVGVLALPAEARGGGERLLHHRGGVDEHLHVAAGPRHEAAGDQLQAPLQHIVIVAVAGIDGDGAAVRLRQHREGALARAVVEGEHHHGLRLWPQHARIGAASGGLGEPVHGAVVTVGQGDGEAGAGLGDGLGAGDADGCEAVLGGGGAQPAGGRLRGQKSRSS